MKLQEELQGLTEKMVPVKQAILNYAKSLKESGKYKDFELALSWDILRSLVPISTICEWYNKYQCNDTHITTLAKKALKTALGTDWEKIVA